MRKRKAAGFVLGAVLAVFFLFPSYLVGAEEITGTRRNDRINASSYLNINKIESEAMTGNEAQMQEDSYLSDMMGDVDFSELDEIFSEEFFGQQNEKITFSSVVEMLLSEGFRGFDYSMLVDWGKDTLFFEMEESRALLVEIVLLAVGFSILSNFSGAFRQAYVSELCFLLVYCVLAVMLLQSFYGFREIVTGVLNRSVEFMKALVPAFCLTMVFSAGVTSSAGFYQMAFLVVYLIQWLFLKVLLPLIHVYVILEICNHFFEEEKFGNLTELLKTAICWGMKIAGTVVLGLNVVQGLIAPARDRLTSGTVGRAAGMIPGVGNAVNGISEILLGSGILIKNSVGAAALLILVLIGLVPLLKILCMAFFYKLTAVLTEPVTDKRIAGCLRGMAEGGILYLKLVLYALALFFLTIAMTAAASSMMTR